MDETWLYHYDPETMQQSMEWRHSSSTLSKKFRVQKFTGKFLASIFWDQDGIIPLIIFLRAKISTPSITHLCWCNWTTFWRKYAAGRSPRVSCSCTTTSRLTGHLQSRRNWPTWASSILIIHPILLIWSRRTATCPLDWKINWMFAIFRPTRRSLLPRRPGWTDNFIIFFFSGLQTLEQRTEKCIDLRGEYVEYIPSLVAAVYFLPGRVKDLSAPPLTGKYRLFLLRIIHK